MRFSRWRRSTPVPFFHINVSPECRAAIVLAQLAQASFIG
jgi:hypothetical protein